MQWDPSTIAKFATDAGFLRPELYTAVAVSLAATNGIDHYDHTPGLPGTGRYVGLWAINADAWPEWTPEELKVPETAAEAAYVLTERSDGFGWSAVWGAGRDAHYFAQAVDATQYRPYRETPAPLIHTYTAVRRIEAMGQRLRKLHRNG
jgi:hypothetical protein